MLTVSSSLFIYDRPTAQFLAEASSVCAAVGEDLPKKFVLRSAKTGTDLVMEHERSERDGEGDLIAIVWKPVNPAFNFRVTLWND